MTSHQLIEWLAEYSEHIACFLVYSVWEYYLGKTHKIAATSTLDVIFSLCSKLFRKGKINMSDEQVQETVAQPDKTIDLGTVGKLELDFSEGVATVSVSAAVPGSVGVEGGAFIKCDAEQLINKLFEVIEKKSSPGAVAIEEGVKEILVSAVKAIK